MWFDVKSALAEIEGEPAPRVAHVARVARSHVPNSKTVEGGKSDPEGLPRALEDLTPDELDHYQERAAIMEFDAGLPRAEAERRARLELVWSRNELPQENKALTRLWPPENGS